MKPFITILAVLAIVCAMTIPADAAVRVRGYFRRNGTYVRPHYRSNPDGNFWNNWSTIGNVNPYTGKVGTKRTPGYSNHLLRTQKSLSSTDYWMDQKVKDIERAKYWKGKGHTFDPTWMSAYQMDSAVRELSSSTDERH
ncbi:MAG: hypothetical protein ISS70_10970 [Phycisphaerae bacterium]|nr:hypothetical protein [Phycisphaerae bacterium]